MTKEEVPPWATGPLEILRHGIGLLAKDSDANRRLAMIAIDNAVELMIKTYLGLPKRITGISVPRKEFQEIAETFPALLDGLEKYAAERLRGVDLGEVEWYHRLRNQLYHQGNGLTVERLKVEVYGELAQTLFGNLFGVPLTQATSFQMPLFAQFLTAWYSLERGLVEAANRHVPAGKQIRTIPEAVRHLENLGELKAAEVHEIYSLRNLRNQVAHAQPEAQSALTTDVVSRVWKIAGKFPFELPPAA